MKATYKEIDEMAKRGATNYCNNNDITTHAINAIVYLYDQARAEKSYSNEKFESAYQMSITPLFEFYMARLLYHISEIKHVEWKIFLRKQVQKCAPDIRIEKNGKTIAIIEITIKAGWMQPFFSQERYDEDVTRKANKKSNFDPQELVDKQNRQLVKYRDVFNNPSMYLLLPTFHMVHRKKYTAKYEDYKKLFKDRTGKSKKFFVVMSKNLCANLANVSKNESLLLTDELEIMIQGIINKSK